MSNNVKVIPENLLKQLNEDFFNNNKKNNITFPELNLALKEEYAKYELNSLDFLSTRRLAEGLCLMKGIDFEQKYEKTKLVDLFKIKRLFTSAPPKDLIRKFDKEEVSKKIIEILTKICEELSNTKDEYSVLKEKEKNKTTKYVIQKNKKSKYLLFQPTLYQGLIYMLVFMPLDIDITTNDLPEEIRRSPISTHNYTPKKPFLKGFVINEVNELILLLEQYDLGKVSEPPTVDPMEC